MGRSPLFSSFPHLQLPAVVGREVEEWELEGEHLFVAATLRNGHHSIQTPAMIDTGAMGFAFIDKNFVRQYKFPHYRQNPPRDLEVIDGSHRIRPNHPSNQDFLSNTGSHRNVTRFHHQVGTLLAGSQDSLAPKTCHRYRFCQ